MTSECLSGQEGMQPAALHAVPEDFPVPAEILDMMGEERFGPAAESEAHRIAVEYYATAYTGRFKACQELSFQLCTLIVARGEALLLPVAQRGVLERYRNGLVRTKWTSEDEAGWIVKQMAQMLNWSPVSLAAHPRRH